MINNGENLIEIGIDINNDNKIVSFALDEINGEIRVKVTQDIINNLKEGKLFKFINNNIVEDLEIDENVENNNNNYPIDGLNLTVDELKQSLTLSMKGVNEEFIQPAEKALAVEIKEKIEE